MILVKLLLCPSGAVPLNAADIRHSLGKNAPYFIQVRRLAREQADAACAALAGFNGPEAEFLRALAEYTITRAA